MPHGEYAYVDIYIALDDAVFEGKPFEIKYSAPANLSSVSNLGKMLARFRPVKANEEYNLETILLMAPVSLMTQQEKGKDGNLYSRVIEGSLKPLEQK